MQNAKKTILVIGSGGREHALCWKLAQAARIFCTPGNGGIGEVAECVALAGPVEVARFCGEQGVNLVVIGPEQPLVEGWADSLRAEGIAVFGPSALAARLEGSKEFTKRLCVEYGIPTAAYADFTDAGAAKDYVRAQDFPLVIKADGLAAGKGVIIAENEGEALAAVDELLGLSGRLVIEEFLEGEEVSFFALSDGETAVEFGHAQDHKRAFDGDRGPNTGGMGTYAPVPVMTDALRAQVMREIIEPTVKAMRAMECPFQGVLFAGLMLTPQGPKLLEYNARFGDPETQVLMRRMTGDLLPWLEWSASKAPLPVFPLREEKQAAVCVVMATKGYPGPYPKDSIIKNLDKVTGAIVFHAGTARNGDVITATGGRVLGVTATGRDIAEAREKAYAAVDQIDWPEGFCRRDIGHKAI